MNHDSRTPPACRRGRASCRLYQMEDGKQSAEPTVAGAIVTHDLITRDSACDVLRVKNAHEFWDDNQPPQVDSINLPPWCSSALIASKIASPL